MTLLEERVTRLDSQQAGLRTESKQILETVLVINARVGRLETDVAELKVDVAEIKNILLNGQAGG